MALWNPGRGLVGAVEGEDHGGPITDVAGLDYEGLPRLTSDIQVQLMGLHICEHFTHCTGSVKSSSVYHSTMAPRAPQSDGNEAAFAVVEAIFSLHQQLLAEVSSLLADLGLSPALADTLRKLEPDHSVSRRELADRLHATLQTSRSSLTDCENGIRCLKNGRP